MDNETISYLENLSHLSLSDDEKTRLAGDLGKILDWMARLEELDLAGVPERSHPFDDVNGFRDDEAQASWDRGLILQNAASKGDETFLAPKTVE